MEFENIVVVIGRTASILDISLTGCYQKLMFTVMTVVIVIHNQGEKMRLQIPTCSLICTALPWKVGFPNTDYLEFLKS